jgi:hypothetical protein
MAVRDYRRGGVLLAAILIVAGLSACHKRGAEAEAYDPPIPKAPLKGRLDTLPHHPEDVRAPSSSPVSGEPPADGALAPKT